jgi:Dyp-type peroxidase family
MSANIHNSHPVDYSDGAYKKLFAQLQGNIVKGHGRDFTANIFLRFAVGGQSLRVLLRRLARTFVTSAEKQFRESEEYRRTGVPGTMFGSLFLTARAYVKLGYSDAEMETLFVDRPATARAPRGATFLRGMRQSSRDLGDKVERNDRIEPLEAAYLDDTIDALLLLADDSESFLLRTARTIMTRLERSGAASVAAVEIGRALRNDDGEGIEHFGYVDGRSQPLFLSSDFRGLASDGSIEPAVTTEAVDDKSQHRESGRLDIWDPFAPLSLALVRDAAVADPDAFGSYYVFRKLEQDVLRFSIAEQQLADKLGLTGKDRERAGAMVVGRFRDGTPLVLSETDGFIPAKANNFRYDGLDRALLARPDVPADAIGLRCPFQAHIRKVSPRQSINDGRPDVHAAEDEDRSHRIVRRGITYGTRRAHPNMFRALDDLPTSGVGLLFACFQSSIVNQFAFMQKRWANATLFKVAGAASTGPDPLIGQHAGREVPQHWRAAYGGRFEERRGLETVEHPEPTNISLTNLLVSHDTEFEFRGFVRFRGGEFFFAPSLGFLLGTSPDRSPR